MRVILVIFLIFVQFNFVCARPNFTPLLNSYKQGLTAVVVQDVQTGIQEFSYQSKLPVKPASVMKLLTSAAALKYLGPDNQFLTEFLVEGRPSASIRTLYVRGNGDPRLRIEEALLIARELKRKGLRKVDRMIVDSSLFVEPKQREGQKAYEAGAAALSFNFNSVMFEVCPTQISNAAQVTVDPWEFPITLAGRIKTHSGYGGIYSIDEILSNEHQPRYKLSGSIGARKACSTYYRSVKNPDLYFGHVFLRLLERLGVTVPLKPTRGIVPNNAVPLFVHKSSTLQDILKDLNQYSNNFIAEQLVAVLGREESGRYDKARGLELAGKYLKSIGINKVEYDLHDGSGLSHDNRLSARALTSILLDMAQSPGIGVEFENSLPVAGRSGTLKKRRNLGRSLVVRAKTGTLRGVTTLAGYVYTQGGRKLAFAILQNNVRSRAKAETLEAKLLQAFSKL